METFGWDVVFLCSTNRVNSCLERNMNKLITTFIYSEGDLEFRGEFGAWKIVLGGSNKLLSFETPVKKGTLKFLGQEYDISGIVPVMQLQLAFIDNATVSGVKDLRFNCTVQGTQPGDTSPGAVTTINPDATGKFKPPDPVWSILHDNLPKCLIANKEKLEYIFANISLIPPGDASWMAPKAFDYVYIEPVDHQSGYMGILSVITDRDISNLQRNVDTSFLASNYDLFYILSKEKFMQNVLMPQLPVSFGHGATAANFQCLGDTITNNGNLDCGEIKAGAIYYHPYLNGLSIQIQGADIKMNSNGRFDITGLTDAYVTFTASSTNECRFDANTKQISFAQIASSHDYSKQIPWWEYVVSIIGGVIILAIVDSVIAIVTSAVSSSVSNSLNARGNLSIANLASVSTKWQGLEQFNVKDAGLSGCFFMRGNYQK
jgi:hypothetical protein